MLVTSTRTRYEQLADQALSLQAVVLGTQEKMMSVNQSEIILETFPDEVTLSRVMSLKEEMLWKDGKVEEIKSTINLYGTEEQSHPKTTFALNYYEFKGQKPKILKIKKDKLVRLFQEGMLSINTYEAKSFSRLTGMPSTATTPFGLEVELVIHSHEGMRQIIDEMK